MQKHKFKTFRSFLSILLVVLMIMSTQAISASAATATEDEAKDAKSYSIEVATEIQKFLANSIDLSEEKQLEYDFNLDGNLTVSDSTLIQKYIAGSIEQLPTRATEPAQTTEPTTVTEPVETTEPTTVTEPVETTEPTTVTEPVETTEPTTVTEPVETTEPTAVTEPVETTEPTTVIEPEQITIEKNSFVLGAGESVSLKITSDTMGQTVKFTSSNEDVATVDQNGKITTKKQGIADIVCALSKNNFVVCNLLVKALPTEFSLNYESAVLGSTEYLQLSPVLATGYTAYAPVFTSSNPNIVTVDSKTGYAVAKLTGSAKIYCTLANGAKAECAITVKPAATSLTLNATSLTLTIGEQYDLDSYVPSGTAARWRPYYSDNPSVAEVKMSGGIVTAKKAGTATIRCETLVGVSATCKVTVVEGPTSLSLSKSSASLKVGQNTSITASANCTISGDKLEWSSSNSYVAKVSASTGKSVQIMPMSQGSATITVKSFNGLKATCKVTVKDTVVKCIDVSSWQGDINFKSVKNAGYDYVILRAGYGNETSQKDNKFDTYYNAAKSAGLKVGAYWYSYAVDNDDALLEAKTCLKCINGKSLDMPIYYDVEDSTQMYYSKSKLSGICKTFCDYIYDNSKYYTGVYTSIGWYDLVDRSYIGSRHSYWVAQIDGDMSLALDFDVHQYTWTLSVNGISTDVDGDKIYNLNIVR